MHVGAQPKLTADADELARADGVVLPGVGAFAAALERKGPDARVIVLPFARYQLPRNLIRMTSDESPPVGAVAGA